MGGLSRGCAAVLAALALVQPTVSTAQPAPPRALFFGDSLFVGVGATPKAPVQARTTASLMGWRPVVDARSGTGYTTGGRDGQPYLARMRQDGYLRTRYDVVVLEGGTNDAHHGSLQHLHAAATRTVAYLRLRQPTARIVLVGAFVAHGVPRWERYAETDRVLARVAREQRLQYVSQLPYSAVTDPGFLSKDRFHPGTEGYRRMARDLAAALRSR